MHAYTLQETAGSGQARCSQVSVHQQISRCLYRICLNLGTSSAFHLLGLAAQFSHVLTPQPDEAGARSALLPASFSPRKAAWVQEPGGSPVAFRTGSCSEQEENCHSRHCRAQPPCSARRNGHSRNDTISRTV